MQLIIPIINNQVCIYLDSIQDVGSFWIRGPFFFLSTQKLRMDLISPGTTAKGRALLSFSPHHTFSPHHLSYTHHFPALKQLHRPASCPDWIKTQVTHRILGGHFRSKEMLLLPQMQLKTQLHITKASCCQRKIQGLCITCAMGVL